MAKLDYLKYCRLYKGQKSLEDNPFKKEDDEFKWYMWRHECNAVRLAREKNATNDDEIEQIMETEILASIELFAAVPFGGDAAEFIKKYSTY